MKILLHACCGPCSIHPVAELRRNGHEVRAFFYNPNIHPYTEFKKRMETFQEYTDKIQLPAIVDESYELDEFLRQASFRESERCRACYSMRLRRAAQVARKGKYEAFTSTLLVSPFQKHQLIKDIGTAIGKELDIPFFYEDFRPGYKDSVTVSKQENMYRQQYCGCIYSERDRYAPKKERKRG